MGKDMDDIAKDRVTEDKQSTVSGDLLLKKLQSLGDGPEGFLKLDTVLTPSPYSVEELREEVMDEFFDDETMDLETARAMLHQTVREEYAKP